MFSAISATLVPVCVLVIIVSPVEFQELNRAPGTRRQATSLNDSVHLKSSLSGDHLCGAARACKACINQHAFCADPVANDIEAGHVINLRAGPPVAAALRGQRQRETRGLYRDGLIGPAREL